MLYMGIDLHKKSLTAVVKKDNQDQILAKRRLPTCKETAWELVRSFAEPIECVLEPVSQGAWFADLLEQAGAKVHINSPRLTKAIAAAKVKTDAIDAEILCDLLRTGLLPESWRASQAVRGWKERCRQRTFLVNQRKKVRNRIHGLLHRHGLQHEFSDLFGVAGRQWLKQVPMPEPWKNSLDTLCLLHDQLSGLIEQATEAVKQEAGEIPAARLLTSIPGLSYVSALTIVAEIGEIARFRNSRALCAYAGLVPSTYQSGSAPVRHGHITKLGSKWLRTIMVEAAHQQARLKRSVGLKPFYLKLQRKRGSKTAAVATARKLLGVVMAVWKGNRPFQDQLPLGQQTGSPNSYRRT